MADRVTLNSYIRAESDEELDAKAASEMSRLEKFHPELKSKDPAPEPKPNAHVTHLLVIEYDKPPLPKKKGGK